MIYKVISIYEADFGCEGSDSSYAMAEIVLEDTTGVRKVMTYPDTFLYRDDINEGDTVKLIENTLIKA